MSMNTPAVGGSSGSVPSNQPPTPPEPGMPTPAGTPSGSAAHPQIGGLSARAAGAAPTRRAPVVFASAKSRIAAANRLIPVEGLSEQLDWDETEPSGWLMPVSARQLRVRAPEGYNSVVGKTTDMGRLLDARGKVLSVPEAILLSFLPGEESIPFYLAIEGAERGGSDSVGQQWATLSGCEVLVQPMVRRSDDDPTLLHGRGPIYRFTPGELPEMPAGLEMQDGKLVLIDDRDCARLVPPSRYLQYLRERVTTQADGTAFDLAGKWTAKIYFPGVDAESQIEHGSTVLARLEREGFPVVQHFGEPILTPVGMVMQCFDQFVVSDHDILTRTSLEREAQGWLPLNGYFTINHARAWMFNEKTIEDLDAIQSLLVKRRPFHKDRGFYNPKIVFDRDGRARFAPPAEDFFLDLKMPTPSQWHAQTKQVVKELRKIAATNVAAQRSSAQASRPGKNA
ncbi:hypothetical protein LJR230_002365 [Trinickia sp. LjRoot230]|uniref:hypothetical protein n=1 Tax=Trinickia sp. LjRoot230 TaxID=3342288 RepID=UPI003ECD6911